MNDEPTFDLELYWRVLRRRGPLLLIPVILMTGIVGVGGFLLPDIFRAQAVVVVRPEQDPIRGLAVETQITQQLGGVIQGLRQPSQQRNVFERLAPVAPRGLSLEAALADYRDNLSIVRRAEGADLIVEFTYEGHPEAYAVELVNAFAEEFQTQGALLVATSLGVSLDFVDSQLETYRQRLVKLDEEERRIKLELGRELGDLAPLSALEGLGKFVAEKLATGDAEIQKLDLQLRSAEARVSYLQAQLAATPPTLSLKDAAGGERGQAELERLLAEGQARLTAAKLQYTDEHPTVQALREQVAELRARLLEVRREGRETTSDIANPAYEAVRRDTLQAEAELRFSRAQRQELVARSEHLRRVAGELPGFEERLARVGDEREAVKATYDSLLQRKQSLELNQSFEAGGNTGRFDVRRAGGIPLRPVRPNRLKYLLLGFLGGLFIGVSFVLLAEYLDHSLRSDDDLKRYLDLPLLAVLPRAPR